MNKTKSSTSSELKSFGNAFKGIFTVAKTEKHFKFHLLATVVVIAGGFYLKVEAWQWVALLFAIGLVLAAEMINSAIERICDYLTLEHDSRIGEIKDIAAGAVLVCSVISALVGIGIFLPKVLILVNNI